MVSLGHRGPAPGGHQLQAGKAGHQDLAEGVSTLCCFCTGQPGGGQDVGGGQRAEPGAAQIL